MMLTKEEKVLFNTVKTELLKKLNEFIDARLTDAIIKYRGDITESDASKLKDEIFKEINSNPKNLLEI